MKIILVEPKAPELVSINDLAIGETFVWPGEKANAYLGGPFMRIWAESGRWRSVRLADGHTWGGDHSGCKFKKKELLRVEAEVTYTEEKV